MPAAIFPKPWTSAATGENFGAYSDVEIQIIGTPGGALTPQRSFDGTNYVACNAYDKDGSPVTSISAAGIYSFDGGGFLKLSGTLAPATAMLRAGQ